MSAKPARDVGDRNSREALLLDEELDQSIDIGRLPHKLRDRSQVSLSAATRMTVRRTSTSLAGVTSGFLKSSLAASQGQSSGGGFLPLLRCFKMSSNES